MVTASSLTLYVHLIPSSTNKIEETVKVSLPQQETVVFDLLHKVYAHLNQYNVSIFVSFLRRHGIRIGW